MGDIVKEESKEGEAKEEGTPGVTLTAEQYDALLEKLDAVEAERSSGRPKDDIESLAEEGIRKREEEVRIKKEKLDWDNMSNTELVNNLVDLVRPDFINLETRIETVKALREIDKCESKYDDFWEYKEEIRRIATQNPTLSIEQSYKLARGDKPAKKVVDEKGEKDEPKRKGVLYTLPPRATLQGEKPGVAPGSTKTSEVKSLKSAAAMAWDEVVGKGKDTL